MKKGILSVFLVLFLSAAFAQDKTVEGIVTDAADKSPVVGANVLVKGTTIGTITDVDGKFKLSVPKDTKTLTVSYVGMTTVDIALPESGNITVEMTAGKNMNEVVVTALGVKREQKSLGYSTQKLDGSAVNTARETNIVNSLQGKVAGVQITGSGNFGGSSRILIRGAKSIDKNNQPLFVVDGVPLDNSNFSTAEQQRGALGYDYGNAAQDINSDDIESINVLKGSAASALYGTRGANGVIMITTKKGSKKTGKGKSPIGVTVKQNFTFEQVSVLPKYQNKYGGGAGPVFDSSGRFPGYVRQFFEYDGSWGPKLDGQDVMQWDAYYDYDSAKYGKATPWVAHPNNIKDFYKTGITSNTSVSLDGANDNGSFRLSFSDLFTKGVFENSKMNRSTLSFSGTYDFSKHIFAGINATYITSNVKGRAQTGYSNLTSNFTQWWQRQLDMKALKDYKNPDGTQHTWNMLGENDQHPYFWDNPYWTLYENYETDGRNRVYGNVYAGAKITSWLNAKVTVTTDYYQDHREERNAVNSVLQAKYSENVITHNENNYEGIVTAHKTFKDKFDVSALFGLNRRDVKRVNNLSETQGGLNVPGFYSLENSVDRVNINNEINRFLVNSVFGNASFGYAGMVFVDLTLRNDWSSTLPLKSSSYFYPGVSASFIWTELLKGNAKNWFSYGKIRGGWAKSGIDAPANSLETRAAPSQSFGSTALYVLPNTLNNANLKSESVYSWEIGTELRLFVDRVNFDLTYYQAITKDNIFRVAQSGASGATFRYVNAGTLENKGVEFASSFVPVRLKNSFEWGIGFNIAKNTNTVKELYNTEDGQKVESVRIQDAPFAVTLDATVGRPYGEITGYDYVYDGKGNKLVDPASGVYLTTSTVKPLGSVLADFTGGVSTWLSWKGVRLYALFDFQKGGHLFSFTNMFGKYSGTLAETAEGDIRENGIIVEGVNATGVDANGNYTTDGTPNVTPIAAVDNFFVNHGYVVNAADVYDASFVKFRELSLTYDLPAKVFAKGPIRGISLGFVCRNLAILKKNVPHIDPESAVSSSNVQGFEGSQLPTLRSMGFNLSFKF